jgi:hypothetical protein
LSIRERWALIRIETAVAQETWCHGTNEELTRVIEKKSAWKQYDSLIQLVRKENRKNCNQI